jgi:hypothetical protein
MNDRPKLAGKQDAFPRGDAAFRPVRHLPYGRPLVPPPDRLRADLASPHEPTGEQAAEETALGLVQKHFHELAIGRRGARGVAAAIYATVQTGEPRTVEGSGTQPHRYVFRRGDGTLNITAEHGEMQLTLGDARRLANWLDDGDRSAAGGLAA